MYKDIFYTAVIYRESGFQSAPRPEIERAQRYK